MAIKNLAVCYNASSNAKTALGFAVQMAKKYDAALTGFYVRTPVSFEGEVMRWVSKEVLASLEQAQDQIGQSMAESFHAEVQAAGFTGPLEWLSATGQPNALIARAARYFDLMLIGQFSEAEQDKRHVRAEDLVTRAGPPLVIVPASYVVRPFQEYAVVAWDGSRVAARALSDAMQILETKKRLDLVTVGAKDGQAPSGEGPAGLDILKHLARHGIEARRVALTASRDGVGPTLLDYCRKEGPDVLVMGAYGHARLREDIFGGVTRHVLRHAPLPLLMAH